MGDQPGQHAWHYLAPWQTLPAGSFIALQKFIESPVQYYTITDPVDAGKYYNIYGFTNMLVPFPTESVSNYLYLPVVAFDYRGQLVTGRDEYIPLAHGSVLPAIDPNTKALQLGSADILETPPGNSTNIAYNIVHIDWLTGRAVLEYHKIGP